MAATNRTKKTARRSDVDAREKLLKQAMKNPGVRDLVEVYENWQRMDRFAEGYRQVVAPKSVVSSSDTSAPNH